MIRVCGWWVLVCRRWMSLRPGIVRAVRLAADGGHAFVATSSGSARAARGVGMRPLTRRERAVFELLSEGRTNAEIAEALCISVGTTRIHVKHVYRKLGVHARGELLGMGR